MAKTRVLVLAAHPDDEVLGCGGTIALHAKLGHKVTVMIAAGRSSAESGYGMSQIEMSGAALAEFGIKDLIHLQLTDQRLDTHPILDLTRSIEAVVKKTDPHIVYMQWGGDVNYDHTALFRAALVAVRPTNDHIREVFAFDTLSSTEWGYPRDFIPDTWVDITTTLDMKVAAMKQYKHELREFPHPRSLVALEAKARHVGSQVCVPAAEAFMTIRRIVKNGQAPV